MVKIIKNNKILFIVAAIVVLCGACLAVILIGNANVAQAARQIKTAEAEAAEQMALAKATPTPAGSARPSESPIPSEASSNLSADALQTLVFLRETRRETIIPAIDTVVITDAKTWEKITPGNNDSIKTAAFEKSAQIASELFGYEMSGDYSFSYYTDTDKHRPDFVQIKTNDGAMVCTLKADTLELINIDYDFIPKGEQMELDRTSGDIPLDINLIADKVAGMFGINAPSVSGAGGGYGHGLGWYVYSVTDNNGVFINFGVLNGELYGVSVYPSEASMQEFVYFDADVQRNESMVYLASPQNFKKGEPGAGDMTSDEAKGIYMSFLNNANGAGNYKDPKMTFYIDHSGTRENYWHLAGDKLTMDIASKSKWIISLTCDKLWNPEHDLTGIAYASMGGTEYEVYVRNIMSSIYGADLARVSNNAVYDYHFCTEDAWMADGTVYEFMFEDGKLTGAQYFYSEDNFRYGPSGWKADSVYINSTTGEEFTPQ